MVESVCNIVGDCKDGLPARERDGVKLENLSLKLEVRLSLGCCCSGKGCVLSGLSWVRLVLRVIPPFTLSGSCAEGGMGRSAGSILGMRGGTPYSLAKFVSSEDSDLSQGPRLRHQFSKPPCSVSMIVRWSGFSRIGSPRGPQGLLVSACRTEFCRVRRCILRCSRRYAFLYTGENQRYFRNGNYLLYFFLLYGDGG